MGGMEMKCDKLNAYKGDVTIPVYGTIADAEVYLKDKADEAIAELKKENERLKKKMDDYHLMSDIRRAKIKELKRALWIARAERAIEKIAWFKLWNASISTMNPEDGARQEFDKWKKNLGKFLKRAKEI
jgi:hypothetical protein